MRPLISAFAIFTFVAITPAAEPLSIGDPAPKLQVKEFVKGDPVRELAKGTVYVVEFWATWCGPCRTSIPHLTELAKEHKDVTFIGVSISEQDFGKVKPFVEKMGDKMDYLVAIDAVPEGKKANEGAMSKNWMVAAERSGIPCAFVIDKDGMVAWIGHPMKMDKPLEQIVAGTWDLKAEATRIKMGKDLNRALARGLRSGDVKDALAAVDDYVNHYPTEKGSIALALNELAWTVVNPDRVKGNKPPAAQLQAAVDAAAKAVDLTRGEKTNMIDTLAQAHFLNGDVAKAIEVQEQALKMQPDDEQLKEHLAAFKKARDKEKDDK